MFSLLLRCSPSEEDRLTADLWEAGTAGIVDEPGGMRAFFESDRAALLARFADHDPVLREEAATDWAQVSRDAWPPVLVGRRFFLVPEWCDDPAPEGRIRLQRNPGMACGTGQHPCTQLCMEAMERYLKPAGTVLDIGTGSGILSAAAMALGAGFVVGCDIDIDSVNVACESVATPFFVGSAGAFRSACADLIVANISAAAVDDLAVEFERLRKPGSTLIVSGFPEWDQPDAFQARETLTKDGWLCFIC